jgi:hypothetical protein
MKISHQTSPKVTNVTPESPKVGVGGFKYYIFLFFFSVLQSNVHNVHNVHAASVFRRLRA